MIQTKSEDAVSPVIGVMLMLVVTIIIAAVVAVFASGVGMDAEPAPTTVINIDGLYGSKIETLDTWFVRNEDLFAEATGFEDADSARESDSPLYVHYSDNIIYFYSVDDGSPVATFSMDTELYEILEPSHSALTGSIERRTEDVTIPQGVLSLSCLHGDVLDLSKVSVKIYHSGTDNIFCEIPQDSLSGILRPGDNLDITLTSKIMNSNRLDIVIYYGEHKIAEEEKLMHKGVKKI